MYTHTYTYTNKQYCFIGLYYKFTYTPIVVYITFVQNVTHCDK